MSTGEFEHLFVNPRDGNQSWFDKQDSEAREWLVGLARACLENNTWPNWVVVKEEFEKTFPKAPTAIPDTISKHVRRIAKELANDG